MIENYHGRLVFALNRLIVDIIARLTGKVLLTHLLEFLLVYFASETEVVGVTFIVAKVPTQLCLAKAHNPADLLRFDRGLLFIEFQFT